jgi:transcriptional regulator with XRE-family HTH domain
MDRSFGSRLREQRERRQVQLSAIADATKIKASLLEGLERDDLTYWPVGIFKRSYVRDYARAIGLDPDVTLREFLELYPDPPEEAPERPQTGLRYLLSSAMGRRPQPSIPAETAAATPPLFAARESTAVLVPATADDDGSVDAAPQPVPPPRAVDAVATVAPPVAGVDLPAVADLCTRLACTQQASDLASALDDAVRVLDAVGLIVWMWDAGTSRLRPIVSRGYPDQLVTRLPPVPREAANGIASAFRSEAPCVIDGTADQPGAIVVPMLTAAGCAGVLALELQHRDEQSELVRACATILAAQLSTLIGAEPIVHAATA